jgi:hypothetical protein
MFGARRKRFDLFQREVIAHFGFLLDLGYDGPRFESEFDFPIASVMHAFFHSPNREIDLEVVKTIGKTPRFMLVLLSKEPRTTTDDDFELTRFIEKRRPDLAAAIQQVEKSSKGFEAFVRSAFPIYASVLADDARKIATGERWESGFSSEWV